MNDGNAAEGAEAMAGARLVSVKDLGNGTSEVEMDVPVPDAPPEVDTPESVKQRAAGIRIGVQRDDKQVALVFNEQVRWVKLHPMQAIDLGRKLIAEGMLAK